MHDNEIDCRYHAYSLMKKEVGSIYRVTEVDEGNEEVSWYISIPKMAPIFKTTPWSDEQQMKVSTGCFKEVDRLCNELRISVVCNKDLQKELEWTASSPLYSNMVMKSKNRSRAVIQLVLWAFYSRTPFSYVGQQKVEQLLKSHKTDIEDILYERGNA